MHPERDESEAVKEDVFVLPEDLVPDERPVIAVSVSQWFPAMSEGTRTLMGNLNRIAFQTVREAGGRPVLLDASAPDGRTPQQILDEHDGLLVMGGADVHPKYYGEEPAVDNLFSVDEYADAASLDLLLAAVDADYPVLALCRGSQLLNVSQGGTLHQDLGDNEYHRGDVNDPAGDMFVGEEVEIAADSKLRSVIGEDRIRVRSGHHQAVKDAAPNLRPVAHAVDGVVEATEHSTCRWVIGLQWHPEDVKGDPEARRRIFESFVQEAASRR